MRISTDQFAFRIALFALSWSGYALSQEASPSAIESPEVGGESQETADAAPPTPSAAPSVVAVSEQQPSTPVENTPQKPSTIEAEASVDAAPTVVDEPVSEETADSYFNPQLNIGVGLRIAAVTDTNVPDQNFGQSVGSSVRPYIGGSVSEHIKFEANLENNIQIAGGDPVATVRVLDALIKLEFHDLANFWVGRFLPPSDRANLSGPYFQNNWNYPVNANLFPAVYAGRQDGMAYWGQVAEGVFKWQVGAFDMTGGDNPLVAGRLVLNVLDPEPGYYNSSTYYGTKDVLAIGGSIQYQKGGDTVTGTGVDGAALEVDLLFEKELDGSGTFTAEGAYYNFTDTGQGQSINALVSYLLPGKQGVGTLQPAVRLQTLFPDVGHTYQTIDGSLNYIIDGHNARFTVNYQYIAEHDGIDADSLITLGGQLQVF